MMNKKRLMLTSIGLTLGVIGLGLIVWQVGWIVAAGVFLALWGNNIGMRR